MNYNNIDSIKLNNELIVIKDKLINNIKNSCKVVTFKFFKYLKINNYHNFKIISSDDIIYHIKFKINNQNFIYFSYKEFMLIDDKLN